jgi:hypothetical protein
LLLVITIWVKWIHTLEPNFEEGMIPAVVYSPYVGPWDMSNLQFKSRSKESYTIEEIKTQIGVITTKFNTVITLGMGVSSKLQSIYLHQVLL